MVEFVSLSIEWIGWAVAAGHTAFNNHRARDEAWKRLRAIEPKLKEENNTLWKALYYKGLVNALEKELADSNFGWDVFVKKKKRELRDKHRQSLRELIDEVDYDGY